MNAEAGRVTTSSDAGIGSITFFHPKGNSLTAAMLAEIAQSIRSFGGNDQVRSIVLRSEGTGAFCGGASVGEFQRITTYEEGEEFFMGFARIILAIRDVPKFVVAEVQGKVVGGGVGIVAAADYAVAHHSASARLSEFELGLGPFVVGPAVERKIGHASFRAMAIDCGWRSAQWLADRGLYAALVPASPAPDSSELVSETLGERVQTLSHALERANPEATRQLKRVLWEGTEGWEILLRERAKTSGRLVADQRAARS